MLFQKHHQAANTAFNNRYTLGIALYRRGEYRSAIDQLAAISSGDELCARVGRFYQGMAHRELGLAALRQGRCDQAIVDLRAALTCVGRQAELSRYLAAAYARSGQYVQCADQMERVVDDSGDAASCRNLAGAQWLSGRREQAIMTLTQGLRRWVGESMLHFQLGLFHAALEQFDSAQRELNKALDADCTNIDARYHLGLVSAARGNVPAAVRHLGQTFKHRPDDLLLAYQLALAARAAGQIGLRVTLRLPESPAAPAGGSHWRNLAQYLSSEPDFIDACLSLPVADIDGELFALLDGALAAALAEHPRYADLRLQRGRVQYRLGRVDEALASVKDAIAINPRFVRALMELAAMLDRARQADEALRALEGAIAAGADWPDAHYQVGQLLHRAGRTGQARVHWERALRLNPSYDKAAAALEAAA